MRPLLRWAGGKRQLVSYFSSFAPVGYLRYVEPFAGSAALFFYLEPRHALLGDLNRELIGSLKTIRWRPQAVHSVLTGWERSRKAYYDLRSQDPSSMDCCTRAARFLYLNRLCFNGLYRTNHRGEFNVPYGGDRSGALPTLEALCDAARLLRQAELFEGDFSATLDSVRPGDFVYLDPPYVSDESRIFAEYGPSVFSTGDLGRLKMVIEGFREKGVSFVLSYADVPAVEWLAEGFYLEKVRVRRNVGGFLARRRSAREAVITNIPRQ